MITHNNTERLECGECLAHSIEALSSERRAWVGVAPCKFELHETPDFLARTLPWKFRILAFEIDSAFDFHEYDLHPEYIHFRHDVTVHSVQEVALELSRFGISLDDLVYPDRCDYPL
jgi:hypothetical protein